MLFNYEYRIIKKSGLFDAKYYLQTYPDIRKNNIDPLKHFIKHGYQEGRNPSEIFITNSYPDLLEAGVNPLLWYIENEKEKSNSITFNKILSLYKNYRKKHPGMNGLKRLSNRIISEIRQYGIKGFYTGINIYKDSDSISLPILNSVIKLDESVDNTVGLPLDVAVHAHIFYPDLANEMQSYLANIPVSFHLYVTTDTSEKAKVLEAAFSSMENILRLDIRITENRGRDIFPMLVTLGAELVKHDIVLHIHTKRSPHNAWELGGWRRYLMESLLGSSQRIVAIFQQFMKDEKLGILFPSYYHPILPFVYMPDSRLNFRNIKKLLSRVGNNEIKIASIDTTFFPAGDMFWFRGSAIKPFIKMGLKAKDFEPEQGQVNGTLAHAVERMFPFFAKQMGMSTKAYLANSFYSQECSAHKIELLQAYIIKDMILNPTIIFDHNGGGGSNLYTSELVKIIHSDGGAVLRVYCFEAVWFVQWIGDGDGMLFYTSSLEELFDTLSMSKTKKMIINSVYGYPDIQAVSKKIIRLVQSLNASLDFKIHDFNALCPSPHLSDYEGNYCGVPKEYEKCTLCLKKNNGWFHHWYPEDKKPLEITEWRKPFAELFKVSSVISSFDKSSVEILRNAFDIEDAKVNVTPHQINYFNCEKPIPVKGPLHIATLGTMSHTKGGNILKTLYDYIRKEELDIPITIVGSNVTDIPDGVTVLGSYLPNDLPEILTYRGINVILMPAIVPETFSYTISEAMAMGLPIVAFDIGAQGNRIKQYELGEVVPLGSSPEVIMSAIQFIFKKAKELRK